RVLGAPALPGGDPEPAGLRRTLVRRLRHDRPDPVRPHRLGGPVPDPGHRQHARGRTGGRARPDQERPGPTTTTRARAPRRPPAQLAAETSSSLIAVVFRAPRSTAR